MAKPRSHTLFQGHIIMHRPTSKPVHYKHFTSNISLINNVDGTWEQFLFVLTKTLIMCYMLIKAKLGSKHKHKIIIMILFWCLPQPACAYVVIYLPRVDDHGTLEAGFINNKISLWDITEPKTWVDCIARYRRKDIHTSFRIVTASILICTKKYAIILQPIADET